MLSGDTACSPSGPLSMIRVESQNQMNIGVVGER